MSVVPWQFSHPFAKKCVDSKTVFCMQMEPFRDASASVFQPGESVDFHSSICSNMKASNGHVVLLALLLCSLH